MRRLLTALVGVVVVAFALGAVWRYLAAERGTAVLVLVEVDGRVELTGPGRPAAAATEGTVLGPDDRLRTSAASRAVLSLGEGTRIRLGPTSSLVVQSVDADGVALELEDGQLQATVR